MALTGWDKEVSPYHSGEIELHRRLGREAKQEKMGRFIHRPYMPDQHREFFAQLPFLIAGSVDQEGWPWASILFGKPGFVSSPDDRTLQIASKSIQGDPFTENAVEDAPVSFVGIELPTRRRNRVNGVVRSAKHGVAVVDVVQSYGNCPQYIHTREMEFSRDPDTSVAIQREVFDSFDEAAREVISKATTFFVASHNPRDDQRVNGGVDVNHRGGNPGFVKIDGDTLTIPDFIGNFAFNTLGNFLVNPKAGLLFVDFETGDLIQLVGRAELLWDQNDEIATFQGAERAWRFHLDKGHRLVAGSPLTFAPGEASPNTKLTGDWKQAKERLAADQSRNEWRAFRVAKIEDESSVIRSFYLEPADGAAASQPKPGQFLTIKAQPEGAERSVIRTYTLSSAPSDPLYRISVKREDARGSLPAGLISSHFHATLKVGDLVEARAPKGQFVLDTAEQRPAVLIGAGVGITPMISMARQAASDGFTRRHLRPLTVIHAAASTSERAFVGEFSQLQRETEGKLRYLSLIENPLADEEAGREFHVQGRLSAELLQSILPLADYDFFLCGPPAFMQAAYDILISLGVRDGRIQAESFGPAALKRNVETIASPEPIEPARAEVRFASKSTGKTWTPEDGTLLEFAEAQGLTPNYGCRSGSCGSCSTKIKSGAVAYRSTPEFPTEAGEALICCAVPADESTPLELDI